MNSTGLISETELERLQNVSFSYLPHETHPDNGLVKDKTAEDWPASIAATGFALAAYPLAVERGFMPRAAAVERTLTTLRFFGTAPKVPNPRPPVIRARIIFSSCEPAVVPGNTNCQR
jgi:hypothetical protein